MYAHVPITILGFNWGCFTIEKCLPMVMSLAVSRIEHIPWTPFYSKFDQFFIYLETQRDIHQKTTDELLEAGLERLQLR